MSLSKTLLIVDDEADFANGLARLAAADFSGLTALTAYSGVEALDILEASPVEAMILDLNMPGMHGLEVIAEARKKSPTTSIVVLTAYGTVEIAVQAIKQGAWDFLTKPVRREELLRTLTKALEHSSVLGENQRLKRLMAQTGLKSTLIGDSPAMNALRNSITAISSSAYTVLIRGESGTGKELVAEAIHSLSDRREAPLVKVNCPAIPESLLESELFGHAKGAFTGAVSTHKGMFVQAAGGTLFLDEVGDIPLSVQTKLLRALQDGEVRPVGSNRATRVDIRIIAATNQNLEAKIREGTFREDFFYRLNVLSLRTPALRERKEDIPLLAAYFLLTTCAEMSIAGKSLTADAMVALTNQDWPGNIRELQSFIRRAAVFSNASQVSLYDLGLPHNAGIQPPAAPEEGQAGVRRYKDAKNDIVNSFTRAYMMNLLTQTGGNISEAARISGLERVSMQKILRRLGITGADYRK